MNTTNGLTDLEQQLLTHAHAMDGWLTAGYMTGDRAEAASRLIEQGLMVRGANGGDRAAFHLTEQGRAMVEQFGGSR